MKTRKPHEAAAAELRRAHAYLSDDGNFAPLLPAPLAEGLRPWLYGLGISIAAVAVLRLMHAEVHMPQAAIAVGLLVLAVVLVERHGSAVAETPAEPTRRPQPRGAVRFPPAYSAEALRLADEPYTGATRRLEAPYDA